MSGIPDEFALKVGGRDYWVRRVPAAAGRDLSPNVPAVWAYRLEGSKDDTRESLPVMGGEPFAQLKDRIARAIAIDRILSSPDQMYPSGTSPG
jgi:hypothetical protein